MFIRSLALLAPFTAGDNSVLRELLNPAKDPALASVRYSLAHATVPPGTTTVRHSLTSSEVYYVLHGRGRMHIDSETSEIEPGDAVYIPPGSIQFIECLSSVNLEFLCIVDPAWTPSCETVLE
jgi:mannose-6-phosphate isomerase-like protein (cupin superfamily)